VGRLTKLAALAMLANVFSALKELTVEIEDGTGGKQT
jgi:hypothetical protein